MSNLCYIAGSLVLLVTAVAAGNPPLFVARLFFLSGGILALQVK